LTSDPPKSEHAGLPQSHRPNFPFPSAKEFGHDVARVSLVIPAKCPTSSRVNATVIKIPAKKILNAIEGGDIESQVDGDRMLLTGCLLIRQMYVQSHTTKDTTRAPQRNRSEANVHAIRFTVRRDHFMRTPCSDGTTLIDLKSWAKRECSIAFTVCFCYGFFDLFGKCVV